MNATLGKGVYSYAEAARLTDLDKSRVREWFRGRVSPHGRKPFLPGDYDPIDGDFAISFLDLVDVYVAGRLRDKGVSLQTLRRVYQKMSENLNATHPFCRKELLTDGKEVLISGTDDEGKEEIIEVLTRQKVFPELILPFLERIEYKKMLARRWKIADGIVVDPSICFGKPIVEAVCVPTAILAEAYHSNDEDGETVGKWYGVQKKHVLLAVQFENRMAA